MENEFVLVHGQSDGFMAEVCRGRATTEGLYQLVFLVSRYREMMPNLYLVVENHLVSYVDFTANGMSFKGQPVIQKE